MKSGFDGMAALTGHRSEEEGINMKEMTLQNIAKACGGQLVLPLGGSQGENVCGREEKAGCKAPVAADTEVLSAVLDSRQVTEGALFVATVGERVDGHRFIGSVYEKGAYCVLTRKTPSQVEEEHGVPASSWGAYILVEDTLQALKDIAEFYRSTLHIPIVGITGSVGKTSTKEFIAGVLSEKYKVLKTEGNFNNEIGVPLTLLRIRKEHEAAVVEMGISDFGEMHRLSKMVRPNVCVITNIGQCHLENLKTRDGILKAKTEIFDHMASDGEVCLNGEDDKLSTVTQIHGKPVHFFGLGGNPAEEVYASDIVGKGLFGSDAVLHLKGTEQEELGQAALKTQETVLPVSVTLPGAHMVINAAAAACVGRLLGLTGEQIAAGIQKVEPVNGRSHLIRLKDYTLIDDCYNANPVSMRAAIDLLNMADNRKIAILGDMFELGGDSDGMHKRTGAYAAESGLDILICIGENAHHIYDGAREACEMLMQQGKAAPEIHYFADKPAFFAAWREEISAGCKGQEKEILPADSTILIKASHGMGFTQIVEALQEE